MGARYRMLMRVGSAEVGGLIEVVEFAAERDLAWNSVTGIDQRGRWRCGAASRAARASSCGPVRRAGGGDLGWLSERLAARSCAGSQRRSRSSSARSSTRAARRSRAPPGRTDVRTLDPRDEPGKCPKRAGSRSLRMMPSSAAQALTSRPSSAVASMSGKRSGVPATTGTPDRFPDMLAAALEGRDINAWAADEGINVA